MNSNTISWKSIRSQVLADPKVKAEYDALETEFNLARQVISLRKASGLSQRDFADKIGIKQPQLARIESGKQMPKLETLTKLASGAGYAVEIHFVPIENKQAPKIEPVRIPAEPS
ncbi:helix-turn-helix domain-containing protein [Scytonema sp. UIC 10036]|uniref:helix-turn-helix domain-containing protein n=1 Tax=Scytonema sp. UIC 10036 TaxID=2304196 RepID=UPI0012DAE380|nr:helix-turn-helix transcriptional regulator [Scytonema sp. UIC 10036]MUG96264.1 helix-turn-helix domain-containing protein [Scytonema sp. UIC 10036]